MNVFLTIIISIFTFTVAQTLDKCTDTSLVSCEMTPDGVSPCDKDTCEWGQMILTYNCIGGGINCIMDCYGKGPDCCKEAKQLQDCRDAFKGLYDIFNPSSCALTKESICSKTIGVGFQVCEIFCEEGTRKATVNCMRDCCCKPFPANAGTNLNQNEKNCKSPGVLKYFVVSNGVTATLPEDREFCPNFDPWSE